MTAMVRNTSTRAPTRVRRSSNRTSGATPWMREKLPELRIDPLSGHKTIVAGERSLRPGGEPTCAPAEEIDPRQDPFAEGHEDRTPPELYAVRADGASPNSPGWTVRVVPNLYPALSPAAEGGGGERIAQGRAQGELF